jgi:hypothetical protein
VCSIRSVDVAAWHLQLAPVALETAGMRVWPRLKQACVLIDVTIRRWRTTVRAWCARAGRRHAGLGLRCAAVAAADDSGWCWGAESGRDRVPNCTCDNARIVHSTALLSPRTTAQPTTASCRCRVATSTDLVKQSASNNARRESVSVHSRSKDRQATESESKVDAHARTAGVGVALLPHGELP